MRRSSALFVLTLIVAAAAATIARQAAPSPSPASTSYDWQLPPRIAAPRLPAGTTMSPARIELGRRLFYDTRLSGNGTQSCGTCHLQALAFTDGKPRGVGSTGVAHSRSAMSLVNVAYRDALTWANPAMTVLEEQALVPLFGEAPVELGLRGHEARAYAALAKDPIYIPLFASAFPGDTAPVTTRNVAIALSAFERSIVSFRSPFDRYREYEDASGMSEAALRGQVLFFSNRKARCISCHRGPNLDGGVKTADSPPEETAVFTFHNTALYTLSGPWGYLVRGPGLAEHTQRIEDLGKFRVPTLRNIALTAPYMHDGSIATLEGVLDHYVAGGRAVNRQRSTGLQPIALAPQERQDLLAFLDSLTDREMQRDPRWGDPWK